MSQEEQKLRDENCALRGRVAELEAVVREYRELLSLSLGSKVNVDKKQPTGGGEDENEASDGMSERLQDLEKKVKNQAELVERNREALQAKDEKIRLLEARQSDLKEHNAAIDKICGLMGAIYFGEAQSTESKLNQAGIHDKELLAIKQDVQTLATVKALFGLGCNQNVMKKLGNILLYAAKTGSTSSVDTLISAGVDLNISDVNQWTPLNYACRYGQAMVVKVLLNAGANKELKDSEGCTAADLARSHPFHSQAYREILSILEEC